MTTTLLPGTGEAIETVVALSAMPGLRYEYGFDRVDIDGNVLDSIDVLGGDDGPHVTRDCTAVTPGACTFKTTTNLIWGADFVAPWQQISSPHYNDGETYRFPLGVYVATSPETPLDDGVHEVTGYDKVYLLKNDIGDTFVVKYNDVYSHKIADLLDLAGIPGAKLGGGGLNPEVVEFDNDWAAKKLDPLVSGKGKAPLIYANDDSNNYQFLDVINEILKATGCRPIYTGPTGKFVIDKRIKGANQSIGWNFMRSYVNDVFTPEFAKYENVVRDSAHHENDMWGKANKFVFIATGLTFDPIEGDGQYTINNSKAEEGLGHYHPPGDQDTLGRVITSVQRIDVGYNLDQQDLIDAAEKVYEETYSDAEKITLASAPWPCAWHFDAFRYLDAELPRTGGRKAQVQSWDLALNGDDMEFVSNVVLDVLTELA